MQPTACPNCSGSRNTLLSTCFECSMCCISPAIFQVFDARFWSWVMHHCLLVPEIQLLICNGLWHEKESRADLASLALTSRALSQQATDRLWFEIDDPGIMFSGCRDLLEQKNVSDGDGPSKELEVLRRPLTEQDIRLVQKCASRVRTLSVSTGRGSLGSLSSEVLVALQAALSTPLVPNMRDLYISIDPGCTRVVSNKEIDILNIFFGPLLRSFNLDDPGLLSKEHYSIFRTLANDSPNLTDIALDIRGIFGNWTIPVDTLRAFQQLESIQAGILSKGGIYVLSSLPRLKNLVMGPVWIPPSPSEDEVEDSFTSGGFPALENLEIVSNSTIKSALVVIDMLESSPLENITLESRYQASLDMLTSVINRIIANVDPDTLKGIDIRPDPSEGLIAISTASSDAFTTALESLCRFPKLNYIHIEPSITPRLSMKTITTLATRFPNLLDLTVVGGVLEANNPGFTGDELITVAKMLPMVESLGLAFDTRSVTRTVNDLTRPGKGWSHPTLTQLSVGTSSIVDVWGVASFLSDVFPHLDDIVTQTSPFMIHDNEGLWRLADNLVPSFALARAQCDAYWKEKMEGRNGKE